MKILRPWMPWLLLIGIILALMIPKWLMSEPETGSERARMKPPVRVAEVQFSEVKETLRLNGTLMSDDSVDLRSEVPGRIVGIYFEEGAMVRSGDVIVKLNDADLQAELARIEASLELADIQKNRQERLVLSGGGTAESFDEARLNKAALAAERERLAARIEMTIVRAPFDGTVGLRQVSLGSRISTDDTIAQLVNLSEIKVEFGVPERHQHLIKLGTAIRLKVPGIETPFEAVIDAVSPNLDPLTRTLTCRAIVKNSNQKLRPGGFGTVYMNVATFEKTILVPSNAVIPGLEKQTVYILEDNKALPRTVVTGLRKESMIQIIDGISPGEFVITSGIQSLRPGIEVSLADQPSE